MFLRWNIQMNRRNNTFGPLLPYAILTNKTSAFFLIILWLVNIKSWKKSLSSNLRPWKQLKLFTNPLIQKRSLFCYLPSKSSIAHITWKRLLARMCPDMRRQMIRSGEGSGAHGTLEGLITRVYSQVSRKLIGSRKPPGTSIHRACMRSLTNRSLTRPVRIFPRLQWQEIQCLLDLVFIIKVVIGVGVQSVDASHVRVLVEVGVLTGLWLDCDWFLDLLLVVNAS